jgi:hypothetical protein
MTIDPTIRYRMPEDHLLFDCGDSNLQPTTDLVGEACSTPNGGHEMSPDHDIIIVDDDPAVRDALSMVFTLCLLYT